MKSSVKADSGGSIVGKQLDQALITFIIIAIVMPIVFVVLLVKAMSKRSKTWNK